MRRISMAARDELVAAIAERYSQADKTERGRILDEFTAITGFHRKHAMRLLRAGQPGRRSGPRPGRRAGLYWQSLPVSAGSAATMIIPYRAPSELAPDASAVSSSAKCAPTR